MKLLERLTTFRIGLIDDARRFYRLASVWVFFVIGSLPDIYNGIASMGWVEQVPDTFKWILRGAASVGIAARVLKQRARHCDDTDKAGA